MQHLPTSFTPVWSSPLATGRSNLSPSQPYFSHHDSPRGAKRSRSKTRDVDMDMNSRRLRPTLPDVQTSFASHETPTPPLSASSSVSSAGSSLASFSSFPRSFSMQNWQLSSTGLPPALYSSPDETSPPKSFRPARGYQALGADELQNYAKQGFATPAIQCKEANFASQNTITRGREARSQSYSGRPILARSHTSSTIPSVPTGSSLPTPPPAQILDAQHLSLTSPADNQPWVESLVGTSMLAIESIWATSASQTIKPISNGATNPDAVLPLQYFIRETLRRSRSNVQTLQVALYYLHRARGVIRERVVTAEKAKQRFSDLSIARKAEQDRILAETGMPTPPGSPSEEFTRAASEVLATLRDPVVCGRRMFLASLICASKFLQDRNYSNRAWSRLSGLPVNEINANERSFLDVLGYELFIKPETFTSWTARLHKLAVENEAKILRLSGCAPSYQRAPLQRAESEYMPAPVILDQPCGSLTSPARMPIMTKSALTRSATQSDLPRRASLGTTSMLQAAQQVSPLPIPRRASDALRYSLPSQRLSMERRGSGQSPFGTATSASQAFNLHRRPSLVRQLSSSSTDCRQHIVPRSWSSSIDVC